MDHTKYSDDQPRDDSGRWSDTGGGSSGGRDGGSGSGGGSSSSQGYIDTQKPSSRSDAKNKINDARLSGSYSALDEHVLKDVVSHQHTTSNEATDRLAKNPKIGRQGAKNNVGRLLNKWSSNGVLGIGWKEDGNPHYFTNIERSDIPTAGISSGSLDVSFDDKQEMRPRMDHKTFSAFTLKADQQQGVVESIVAVMGNDDQGDDVIHNGAFLKTITERRGKIRVLDQHQTDSIMRAIGKPLEMREIGRDQLPPDLLARYPSATGGLYTKTQYLMDTPEGKGAFQRIAAGAVDEYSIGYDPLDVDYSKIKKADGSEKTVRNLRTIKLYEYSPVLFGMNDATQTLSAKGATGAADLPLADRSRAWDSTAANARVRTWADATDAPNAKYRSAFFWYDASAPDNFTSYKLQFADVVDGTLTAIPRGIFAVAAVLQGSRGGVDIPAGDKEAVKGKVSSYYAKMRSKFDDESIVAPWDAKSRKDAKPWNVFHEGDKWNVYKVDENGDPTGDRLGSFDTEAEGRAQVRALYASENAKAFKSVDLTTYVQEVTEAFNEEYGMSGDMMMPAGECFCIWRVYDDHVVVCEMMSDDYYSVDYTVVNGEYQFATQDAWIEGSLEFVPDTAASGAMKRRGTKAARPFDAAKAGRVMAQRNVDRIMSAMQSLMAALSDAGIDMAGTSDNTDGAPAKRAASSHDSTAQAGPTYTSPTDDTLMKSIEIELEELKLLEV